MCSKNSEERVGWQVRTLMGHTKPVTRAQFSDDGKHIFSMSSDGTVRGSWYEALLRLDRPLWGPLGFE